MRAPSRELADRALAQRRLVQVLGVSLALDLVVLILFLMGLGRTPFELILGIAYVLAILASMAAGSFFALRMQRPSTLSAMVAGVAGIGAALPLVSFCGAPIKVVCWVIIAILSFDLMHAAEKEGFKISFAGRLTPGRKIDPARDRQECRHCGYSLAGLPDLSPCPECGKTSG